MKGVGHIIFVLLTLYVNASTAEMDPSFRVDAMNFILSQSGWPAIKYYNDFGIVVRWMGEAEQNFSVDDLLATGPDSHIVNYDNVACKVRQAHQLLSCLYANNMKVFYDYNIGAAGLCKNVAVPAESLECVGMVLEMIREIDEVVERMLGRLSGVYLYSPNAFDQDVSNALVKFKSYYTHLDFDSRSLDKRYHDEIINSTEQNMATAIQLLAGFYNNHCKPDSYAQRNNGVSKTTESVNNLAANSPPFKIVKDIRGLVSSIVDDMLYEFDELCFGFKYDPSSRTTSSLYSEPSVVTEDPSDTESDTSHSD